MRFPLAESCRSRHTRYTASPQKDITLPMTHSESVIPTEPTPAKIADGTVYAPTPTVLPTMMLMADMTPTLPSSARNAAGYGVLPGDDGGRNHVWSVGVSSEMLLLPSSSSSSRPSHITREFGVLTWSGTKVGGSRYGDFAAVVPLFASTSCDGRIGDRHVRLKDDCKGEAAVDMAPLMKGV